VNNREIARVVAGANRELQLIATLSANGSNVGVSPHWDYWHPDAQNALVQAVAREREDPAPSAEESHLRWMAARQADGWIHGPVKDEAKKTHPNLVRYEVLPELEKAKDNLFRAIVAALK
jgi:hypothetical protein